MPEQTPEIVEEPTSAEVVAEVKTPTTSDTTTVTSDLLDSDAFVSKVADAVFDKMKGFTSSLLQAQEAAAEIAADMVPIDNTPPPAEPEQIAPDSGPERRHRLFAQPMKRKQ